VEIFVFFKCLLQKKEKGAFIFNKNGELILFKEKTVFNHAPAR